MQSIVKAASQENWPAQIAAVISNRADAAGLEFAKEHGIATAVVASKGVTDRAAYDQLLRQQIDSYQPDLVVLAGFMRILSAEFVAHYAGRIMNIHPSLLPAFIGLHTHQQALTAGVKVHGATVHFVTAELDHGPIIAQAVVPVMADDDENSLAARVLQQEHLIYPQAVRCFVEDKLQIQGNRVITPT